MIQTPSRIISPAVHDRGGPENVEGILFGHLPPAPRLVHRGVTARISMTITVPIDLPITRGMDGDPQLLAIARKLLQRQHSDPNATLEHWIPSLCTLLDCTQLGRAFGIQIAAVAMRTECPNDDPVLQQELADQFRSELGESTTKELIAAV